MTGSDFTIEAHGKPGVLGLTGALDLNHLAAAKKTLKDALAQGAKSLDLSQLRTLDTAGALTLLDLQEQYDVHLRHVRPEHAALFDLVAKADVTPLKQEPRAPFFTHMLIQIGQATVLAYRWILALIAFLGRALVTFWKSLPSPRHLRGADIMHHIEETGINAIPIIGTMAFMIAVVLAYQGVAQLRPLGAEGLTVNLVAISVLREMGVLLTAIMVAGRSGSAFTAEIGVMKIREEVDALQVIGIDPFEVLVLPRIIALIITLPLLTFIADLLGLLGGGLMSSLLIDISLPQYIERVRIVAKHEDFLVGMIKAPVFAFLIGMIGCMHGMKVSGSAESVGLETTAAVVKSIFLVLVVDAFFSILFDKLGI